MRTSSTIFTAAAICSLASALPTSDLISRAGGPAVKPIPANCTVTRPLTPAAPPCYLPAPAATTTALLYSAYYPSFSSNTTQMALQCLQQCYGYGNPGQCKTAYWAENVVVPKGYYGTEGGYLSTACLMFDRALTGADFVAAPQGQATDAFAATIEC